jgi:hypothetical protein
MNRNYLFPHVYRFIGWIVLVPGLILGLAHMLGGFEATWLNLPVFVVSEPGFLGEDKWFGLSTNNLTDELAGVMLIIGLAFVAFSRERSEDEFIARIRLESLLRATYLNYGILLLTIVFMYGSAFFWVLVFNMFTILLFFIVHFNLALAKARRNLRTDEESYQG